MQRLVTLFLAMTMTTTSVFAQDPNALENSYNNNYNKPTNGYVIEKPKTAEEQKIDKEYVNQEFNDKMKMEACQQLRDEIDKKNTKREDKMKEYDPCSDAQLDDIAYVIDPTVDKMIPILGKAYSSVFGLGGSTVNYNKYSEVKGTDNEVLGYKGKDANGNETTVKDKKDATKEKEEKKDACVYIPMVTEMGATAFQTVNQQNIQSQMPQDNASMQTEFMYAMSRSHKSRKQAAVMQGVGWGATTACYTGYLISGAALDVKMGLKLATSAAFTVFYSLKAKNHDDWANKLKTKADHLKGLLSKKNCDPVGERQCYCSMDSTRMDPQYCLKKPKPGKSPKIASEVCIGANIQVDPNCDCRAAGTCFDHAFASDLGSISLGNTYLKSALDDVGKISNSGLDYSTLDGSTFGNLAMAKQALRNLKPEDVGALKLNAAQKADANFLIEKGLPPLAAALLASLPESEAGNKMAASMRTGSFATGGKYNAANNRPADAAVHFSNSNSGRKNNYDDDDRPQIGSNKSSGGSTNAEILNFAQKAERAAEIRRSPETPIFDIISYRYRSSAWKRFDVMNAPVDAPAPKEVK